MFQRSFAIQKFSSQTDIFSAHTDMFNYKAM